MAVLCLHRPDHSVLEGRREIECCPASRPWLDMFQGYFPVQNFADSVYNIREIELRAAATIRRYSGEIFHAKCRSYQRAHQPGEGSQVVNPVLSLASDPFLLQTHSAYLKLRSVIPNSVTGVLKCEARSLARRQLCRPGGSAAPPRLLAGVAGKYLSRGVDV